MAFKITLVPVCNVWGSIFLSHRDMPALLSTTMLGLSLLQQGSHHPCRHRALLDGASSHMFPSGANCIKHRKGERLIQVVCIKPGLQDHRGQVELCTEQIWSSSLCLLLPKGTVLSSSPVFQLPAATLGRGSVSPQPQGSPCSCTSAHSLYPGP